MKEELSRSSYLPRKLLALLVAARVNSAYPFAYAFSADEVQRQQQL